MINYILITYISLTLITLRFTHQYVSTLFVILHHSEQEHIKQKLTYNHNFHSNIQDISKLHFQWASIWTPITLLTILLAAIEIFTNSINLSLLAILIATSIVPIITFKKPPIIQPTIDIIDTTIKLIKLEQADGQLRKLFNILSQVNSKKLILPDHDLEHIINETKFLNSFSKSLTDQLKDIQ